ncbi:MAG: non-ribosomal peptide synthetase, partial [Chloroflexi bacterium]|nr:non-ribosomal peptide synthetase [Chloroflexota bacterium]
DRVRFRSDGSLEYLERMDTQVKLRGYRIELGEIETLLEQEPGVQQAVVSLREDVPGDKRLVAYVTPAGADAPSPESLRGHLKDRLPGYMVPSATVVLERFPLTPNGKVDRKALPAPSMQEVAGPGRQVVPPRTETERRIAEVWQDVLNRREIGVTDNFFDLGGHSLLILQVHARLRQVFETELTVAHMFQYPTIAALATQVRQPAQSSSRVARAMGRGQQFRAALAGRGPLLEEGLPQ